MTNEFALDLKVARKKAGLTQADCAHLLSVDQARISLLERGKAKPSMREFVLFSVIFGRPLEQLFSGVVAAAAHELRGRLPSIPTSPRYWPGRFSRSHTLQSLAERLAALGPREHGGWA